MSAIAIKNAQKDFNTTRVIHSLDLDIPDGSFFSLLGASGCGKTTTLRSIAGLEQFTSGEIYIGEREVSRLSPDQRDIAFVFQLYSLYPHLKVKDNIAFPLRAVNTPKEDIEHRVNEVTQLLGIEHLLNQRPSALSGGDMQRVAIARALVRKPQALLMDEPIGALDAKLREELRGELKRLHQRRGTTIVYVTHDQSEAMALSDHIAIMHQGHLQQVGTPFDIYHYPINTYVARFIGAPAMNTLLGSVGHIEPDLTFLIDQSSLQFTLPDNWKTFLQDKSGERFQIGIRPEHVKVSDEGMPVTIDHIELCGSHKIAEFKMGERTLKARLSAQSQYEAGCLVKVSFSTEHLHLFEPDTVSSGHITHYGSVCDEVAR
ncbi:ABC transporter ATP-binding protein [Vibrio sp. S9_S30]|uniref:ABC transporter ATP-binding protein n=1 Tax=Vibrio sp. S9_S30 TaxID=2720226 RepID=UPI00168132EF|nr:ABC transporter ATP-binding protein [Vibrio sp. S9_S30]MBD1556637.1 ABC transporter ATP-binding protein [Vibrio sp. S9_S30]